MTRTLAALAGLALAACSALPEAGRVAPQEGESRERIHGTPWPELVAETGPTVAVRAGLTRIGGDFDGHTSLVGPDVILVPDADDGTSGELALGYRGRAWGFELAFLETRADGEAGGRSADVRIRGIALDALTYFRLTEPVQPFLLFGISGHRADLDDASIDNGRIRDAELSDGFGFRLGGGAAWFWSPHLSLELRLLHTWIDFSRAEGAAGKREDIDDPVEASPWDLSLGLRFTF